MIGQTIFLDHNGNPINPQQNPQPNPQSNPQMNPNPWSNMMPSMSQQEQQRIFEQKQKQAREMGKMLLGQQKMMEMINAIKEKTFCIC